MPSIISSTYGAVLTGCDQKVILAHKREVKEIDWGFVGDIDRVDTGVLAGLLHRQVMPVISPITYDGAGQLLNTNADSVDMLACLFV